MTAPEVQMPVLVKAVDNFKKHLEDIRKTKEINSTFNSKLLHQNIQEIVSVKQKLAQSRTELQQNCNEAKKLKDHIAQVIESDSQQHRHVDICEHLKDLPMSLQYDNDIWNEYFLSRVQLFQNKMRIFKNQFEQLEDYFRTHDRENQLESQKIVETMKATHKNLMIEASQLKMVHESVEDIKRNYLIYRRSMIGDATNVFENKENEENNS